jgi:hypothetical protein
MPDIGIAELRSHRHLRETSLLDIRVACVTVWVASAWLVLAYWMFSADTEIGGMFGLALVSATLSTGLGWWLWSRQSRAAAWALMVLAAGNLAYRVVLTESLGGATLGVVVCLAYYRAWRGTETLHELRRSQGADAG